MFGQTKKKQNKKENITEKIICLKSINLLIYCSDRGSDCADK